MDDHELVRQCLNGQTHAFGILVDRYQKPLYNTALRMVKNAQDAEDVTQIAFLKAYEGLDSFNPSYRFFSWIYRITVNESLNLVKGRRSVSGLDGRDWADETSSEDDAGAFETNDRLEMALGYLTPEDRAIVLLKHVEGFSYDEIAYVFDISLTLVKSRLYTARQRLKDAMLRQRMVQKNG